MENKHYLDCEAAICRDDPSLDYKKEVPWFPGEKVCVCKKGPYEKFQKKQLAINKEIEKGTFRKLDEPYTAYQLEHQSI